MGFGPHQAEEEEREGCGPEGAGRVPSGVVVSLRGLGADGISALLVFGGAELMERGVKEIESAQGG